MKLKAAVFIPDRVRDVLDSRKFAQLINNVVFERCLGLRDPGPAEAYVQESDTMIDRGVGFGCEVRLSGVSVNKRRSTQSLWDARAKLEESYSNAILGNIESGERVQLFVSIMCDTAPFGESSSLLEGEPTWITLT